MHIKSPLRFHYARVVQGALKLLPRIFCRTFIYSLLNKGRHTPLQIMISAMIFCSINGFFQGYNMLHCAEYEENWWADVRLWTGMWNQYVVWWSRVLVMPQNGPYICTWISSVHCSTHSGFQVVWEAKIWLATRVFHVQVPVAKNMDKQSCHTFELCA